MVEYPQRIEQATNASPVRPVRPTQFPQALRQPSAGSETEGQAPPIKVEDKVDLQLEPEAIRQLQPNTHLKFVVSDDTNRVIVQIIESETNQVLREVPPKSLSDALAALNGSFGKKIR
jgi:flagellar protein FlaG